jgi:hypothetical protein
MGTDCTVIPPGNLSSIVWISGEKIIRDLPGLSFWKGGSPWQRKILRPIEEGESGEKVW